jgi:hypothetical protein
MIVGFIGGFGDLDLDISQLRLSLASLNVIYCVEHCENAAN